MSIATILLPVFVQVALTFALLISTGRSRSQALKAREIEIADIALGQAAWPTRPTQFGRAYQNQFETPILFYVLVGLALITHQADLLFVVLSWAFVAARLVHAGVHVTSNHVQKRFVAFIVAMSILLTMWIIFAVRILSA